MARAKRTISSYASAVDQYAAFVPSLKKYKKRGRKKGPRFSPAQKAAITRAEKAVRAAGGGAGILHPLTERQAKNLKDKSIIVGGGVRAVRLKGISPDTKISVVKGRLVAKSSSGREWYFRRSAPFPKEVVRLARQAFTKFKAKQVDLWLVQGRLGTAVGLSHKKGNTFKQDVDDAIKLFVDFVLTRLFEQYASSDPDFDDWFQGIAYAK